MQLKKYIANSMPEAIKQIKLELGNDAVILSTRKVKKGGGAFGLFGQYVLEVTAAKDMNSAEKSSVTQHLEANNTEPAMLPPPFDPTKVNTKAQTDTRKIEMELEEIRTALSDLRKGIRVQTNEATTISHLRYEVNELKSIINKLITQTNNAYKKNWSEALSVLYQQLCSNGVEEKFASRLIDEVSKKIPKQEANNFTYVKIYLARLFMQVIPLLDDLIPQPNTQNIFSVIGPTGVGKTTTLAKIASIAKLNKHKIKIGLITLDTFRIGAVNQLEEYSQILRVPCKTAFNSLDLEHAIQSFKDKDLILIDTSGKSQRDATQMNDMKDILLNFPQIRNLLVLSTTTKDGDLTEITKRFSIIPLYGLILTKLDETTCYGSVFNHAIRFKLPLAYLTTGQNVPDDMEKATRERLIDLLLDVSNEIK